MKKGTDKNTIDTEASRTRLLAENEDLRARLEEAEQTLEAIRSGGVDALVVQGGSTPQVYTLEGADFPYRSIVETMAAGAVTLDRYQTIAYCNVVFSLMVGIPMERLIGSSFVDLVPAERRDTFMDFIERSRTENSQQELPLRTGSDKELYVHLAGGCELHDLHSRCIVVTDISARKRAEEALQTAHDELERRVGERTRELRESEARYRSLFSNMLDGFAYCEMVFDDGRPADFVYLEVNDAFERLTGLKDLAGKRANEVLPGIHEANPELFEIYGLVASTGKPQRLEIDLKPRGTWFLISVYATEKQRFVAVLHDLRVPLSPHRRRLSGQAQALVP
jgi:PAS domain S-box-containing protein